MLVQTDNFGYEKAFRCRLHKKAYSIPVHIHQYTEVVIVLDGSIDITLDKENAKLTKGQAAIFTPFSAHSFKTDKTCELWICVFSNDIVSAVISESELFERKSKAFTPSEVAFDYMLDKLVMNEKRDELSIKAGLYVFLEEYLRISQKENKREFTGVLSSVILYVSQHYKEDLTLSSAAKALGYSSGYISHTVCMIPGMSFLSLLSGIRVEEAKKLLIGTDMPVSMIALESGFGCERSFHRAFYKLTGAKPLEYRRLNRG